MDLDRRPLRVFVSSPDDVKDEREACRRVIARLAREFRHEFELEAVLWEWQPLLADAHFQSQIPAPRETDITVVILWSRLGTYLPEQRFPGPLSGERVTGTEWEFEDALSARRQKKVPELLVYRKRDADLSVPATTSALDEQRENLRLVERFFERWFQARPDGNVDIALRAFQSLQEFESIFEAHLRELLRQRIGPSGRTVSWHAGSPYRGLLSFEPEHADVFFGRAKATRALRAQLERRIHEGTPFLVVLGASGSGKSSFVKASMIPQMQAGAWVGGVGLCRYASFRPGDDEVDPLAALARALLQPSALPELQGLGFHEPAALQRLLHESPESAAKAIAGALRAVGSLAGARAQLRVGLVIAVDQLEEIFASGFQQTTVVRFIDALDSLSRILAQDKWVSDAPLIIVVATMRSDFYGQLDRIPRLAQLVQGDGQFLLLPPDAEEVAEMLRSPARLAGLAFEHDRVNGSRLDTEILEVARHDTRVLPLLSFLLDQLWQRRTRDGLLTLSAYRALGGLEGALARRAEETLGALPAEVADALPAVLSALVHASPGDPSAENTTPQLTSCWCPIERFPPESPERSLIERLLAPEARLLVAEGDHDKVRVRVAHEALLSHWPRACDLLESSRWDLILRERLEQSAELFERAPAAHRNERLLAPGLPLAEAADLLRRRRRWLSTHLVAFVEASIQAASEAQTQRVRRTRVLAALFGALAVLASAGWWTARRTLRAEEQARAHAEMEAIASSTINIVLPMSIAACTNQSTREKMEAAAELAQGAADRADWSFFGAGLSIRSARAGILFARPGVLGDRDRFDVYIRGSTMPGVADEQPHPFTSVHALAMANRAECHYEAALAYYELAARISRATLPDRHWYLSGVLGGMGAVLIDLKRFTEAEVVLLESYAVAADVLGKDDQLARLSATGLALLYKVWGKPGLSREWNSRAGAVDYAATDFPREIGVR